MCRVWGLCLLLCACGEPTPVVPQLAPVIPVVDAGAPAAPRAQGQLERPSGQVTLERRGQARPAKQEPLYVGDAIDTGPDGSAVLRFGGDRVVELGPDGRFVVEREGEGVALNVTSGLVLTRVRESKGAAPAERGDVLLTIATPFGLTRIGAAEVQVKVDPQTADVDVRFGEIALVTSAGETKTVRAGEKGALGAPRELPPIPMEIVAASGRAELKKKDSARFVAINPRAAPAVAAGDTLRVKDGRVTLTPQGSQAQLTAVKGTEVRVSEVNARGSALELTSGQLEVSAPVKQVTRVAVAPGLYLVSDLGGQFTVRRTGAGFDVDALTGDVRLEREGAAAAQVQAGGHASVPLQGTGARVTEASREAVALPPRPVRLYHSGLRAISLTWDGVMDGDARVQVASDGEFKKVVRDGVVHGGFLNVPALSSGAWFWRVFDGETEKARGQVSFAPEPKSADLSRLQNEVRESAETTSIYFQDRDKPPAVTLVWKLADGAAKSTVRVYREGELEKPMVERTVAAERLALPENSLGEGRYRWSVTPLDAGGRELRGGRLNKLQLVFDNAVPSLLIKSPRNGESVGKTARVAGVAPIGSRLQVNGRPITLDAHAGFDAEVVPQGGRVVFRLLQPSGESWTVRTVRAR